MKDKALVAKEIQRAEPKPEYEKIVKDPYVMEFLQIQPDTHVYEGELEQALIDHFQHFLLELGRGFSFDVKTDITDSGKGIAENQQGVVLRSPYFCPADKVSKPS